MKTGKHTNKLGVYAGSFDPLTIGHLWMIQQGALLFDKLVVAIGINPEKRYTFSLEERLTMLKESLEGAENISVTSFSNRYLIDFANSVGATHVLRGIRTESDYEYERTMRHINGDLDGKKHLAQHAEALELAIWFHDAVYNPKAQDNEERSAELAMECLKQAGLGNALVEHSVAQLILATKHHDITIAPDAPLLVDIDLSIFGQPENRFFKYEAQIRQEYAWVPEPVFRTKRAEILEAFLARPRLYATDWFHQKYEQQARRNLLSSLQKLKNLNA